MVAVILTIHALVVLALIGVVLVQRSDGGALGLGGGGGGGGFMSGRGAANALTRTTSILAAVFFATSLGLAIMAGNGEEQESLIEELTQEGDSSDSLAPSSDGGTPSTEDLLNSLGTSDEDGTTLEESLVDEISEGATQNADTPADDAADPASETPTEDE